MAQVKLKAVVVPAPPVPAPPVPVVAPLLPPMPRPPVGDDWAKMEKQIKLQYKKTKPTEVGKIYK